MAVVQKTKEWDDFFAGCLRKRIGLREFNALVELKWQKAPVSGAACIGTLLRQDRSAIAIDPRFTGYVESLVESGKVDIPDVLDSILRTFEDLSADEAAIAAAIQHGKKAYEASILEGLIQELAASRRKSPNNATRACAIRTLKPFTAWLVYLLKSFGQSDALASPLLEVVDAFGHFAVAYMSWLSVVGVLDHQVPKEFKRSFGGYLPLFITLVSHNVELAHDLNLLQKQTGLHEDIPVSEIDNRMLDDNGLNTITYQESVLDSPPVTTRAGLYIYINAMLMGRPLSDDAALFDYLNVRYHSDVTTLVTDIVTASFDTLTNAINRTESTESITLIRSFITNKLPTILSYYSGMIFPPLSIQFCVSQALSRMDPAADMPYTQMVDSLSLSGMLADARSEFLFACALHQLIPEQSIEEMLGEVPMQSMPDAGRYSKDDLVSQCTARSARIDELIGELENMEGNAGDIVGAIVEIVQSLCVDKNSITLKGICNVLSRKTQTLDIIMLFIQPETILQPLCQLIDQWQDHDDQGENHPVYDEFGSIFLLILIIRHHFALPDHHLGIDYQGSFMMKFLRSGHIPREPSTLTEQENRRLGDWIRGIYETEGINDELMSACSPKDFHLLVATLFDQSLKACQVGKLSLDTLKGGFEYLLYPFLLPSLITGLGWFAQRLWETESAGTGLDTLLPGLQALVKPPSISGDSAALHEAVLSVVAEPLTQSLMHVQALHPRKTEIDIISATLKSHTQPRRCDASSHAEMEAWCATSGGGILTAVRHTAQSLAQWCNTNPVNAALPNYTHRQILSAMQVLGAKSVVEGLVDEIGKQMSSNTPDVILDIVTALITAPTDMDSNGGVVYQGKRQLTLRDALNGLYDDAYQISKNDAPRAEIIVRLHRRVEAQLARSNQQNAIVTEAENAMLLDLQDSGQGTIVRDEGGIPEADIDNVVAGVMDEIMAEGGDGGDSFMEL